MSGALFSNRGKPGDNQGPQRLAAIRAGFEKALHEAFSFMGATSPNPAVGCTLLDQNGSILVTEAHHRAGAPHAEALALQRAREKGVIEQVRIALVTLEPCNHTGLTPPCSEALRNSPVQEVWIGTPDTNPVAGGGIARLRQMPGGRKVVLLQDVPAMRDIAQTCDALIAPFATRIREGRPWITVKQAVTADGSMIPPAGQTTFTSHASLVLAHRLRRATDAIITGVGTILADAPRLSVRHVPDHDNRAPRMVVVCDRTGRMPASWRATMEDNGFRIIVSRDLAAVPAILADHGVNWAMVESGPGLLDEVRRIGLWDDWLRITSHPAEQDSLSVQSHGPSPLRFLFDEGAFPLSADKAAF